MKNCFSCKNKNDCDFGEAVTRFEGYTGSNNGLGTVVELLVENIHQYVDCEYYEDKD